MALLFLRVKYNIACLNTDIVVSSNFIFYHRGENFRPYEFMYIAAAGTTF